MSERAERLRERVRREIRLIQADAIVGKGGRDTHEDYAGRILRAVVEEAGVTEVVAKKAQCRCGYYFAPDAASEALAILLEAASEE